jgi:hypothetical protein
VIHLLAVLLTLCFSASASAQQLIPVPIKTSSHELSVQSPPGVPQTAAGPSPLSLDWSTSFNGIMASGVTTATITDNVFTLDHAYDLSATSGYVVRIRQDHIITFDVPDVGTPTTTIVIRLTDIKGQNPSGTFRTSQTADFESYVSPAIGLIANQTFVFVENRGLDGQKPQESLLLTVTPGQDAGFQFQGVFEASWLPPESAGSLRYEFEVLAVPEPSASLLGAGSLGALAMLRLVATSRSAP